MRELEKLFETCESVMGLPCDMSIHLSQQLDEDEEPFLGLHGDIRYFRHIGDTINSVTFNFALSPDSSEESYADLSMCIPESPTTQRIIRYELQDGVISRFEQNQSTQVQDQITFGNPFALERPIETERRETKYTLRALARLAALATRNMTQP